MNKPTEMSPIILYTWVRNLLSFTLPVERSTLHTDDYKAKGYDMERKEINDLVQFLKNGTGTGLKGNLRGETCPEKLYPYES